MFQIFKLTHLQCESLLFRSPLVGLPVPRQISKTMRDMCQFSSPV